MIRNNLSLILVERQLRISQVSNDTGISRTTLTGLSQNNTKMIQTNIINTLCNYLEITPNVFFEYVPFDFSYSVFMGKDVSDPNNQNIKEFELEAFLNISKNKEQLGSVSFKGNLLVTGTEHGLYYSFELSPSSENNKKTLSPYLKQLSTSFVTDIKNEFIKVATNEIVDKDQPYKIDGKINL